MLTKILTAASFIAIVLLSGCNGTSSSGKTADGYILKFNLSKGTRFNYTINMDMNMNETVMGKPLAVKNNMIVGYDFDVTGDSSGWKTVGATISRIAMNMNANGMSVNYDSDVPDTASANNPMAILGKVLGAMKGGEFSFTINEKGEVGEVRGMNEMIQNMIAKANIPNSDMVMQSVGKSFDADNFKQNIQQSFDIYPDKPVKIGDSWTKTLNLNSGGISMLSNNTFTLQSVNGDDAILKVDSKISSGADSAATMGVKVSTTGNIDGTTTVDLPTGLSKEGNMNMKMNMQINSQGMNIPMDMDIKMKFESRKL